MSAGAIGLLRLVLPPPVRALRWRWLRGTAACGDLVWARPGRLAAAHAPAM